MNEKRKVNLKIFIEEPLSFYGGGQKTVVSLANFMGSNGISVSIVENTCSGSLKRVSDEEISSTVNCRIERECFELHGFSKYFRVLYPSMETLGKADVSMIFLRRIPPNSYLKSLFSMDSKIILCLHGIAMERFRLTNPFIMVHQMIIRRQLSRLAKFVKPEGNISVQFFTRNINDYLVSKGAEGQKLYAIESGISIESAYPGRNDLFFQVVFIGRIEDLSKGIRRLRSIIEKSYEDQMDVRYVIIGSGSDEKMLKNLPKNAEFLNFVDEGKKREELLKSNLMIITSNLEPFSLVAIEGLSYGIPIVTTPTSGPMSILSHYEKFGRVSTFNTKNIVSDIFFYFSLWKANKNNYYEMKCDISGKAKLLFDESRMGEDYLRMILGVVGRSVRDYRIVQGGKGSVL
ncbi:MAG: glycosyltransferase [Candidatus Micrarchaeia archaeon]